MDVSFPENLQLYVIGDVHGCIHLLKPLAQRIAVHMDRWRPRQAATIMLGDYIDRGPASRDVVELLIHGFPTPVIPLRGNHEELLLNFIDQPKAVLASWGHYGGFETLTSYGVKSPDQGLRQPLRIHQEFMTALPPDHLEFYRSTRLYSQVGPYFFCHAGIRPGVPLDLQDKKDLLGIRGLFLEHKAGFEKIIVHGHTISSRPQVLFNRIGIDTGAYATGCLTCLLLRSEGISFL